MRAFLAGLVVAEIRTVATARPPWFDCDTEDNLATAEQWCTEPLTHPPT
jgi:hypothetical protein